MAPGGMEPDISIHITRRKNLPAKRVSTEQKGNPKPSKRTRKPGISHHKSPGPGEEQSARPTPKRSAQNTSFRHLFSFGKSESRHHDAQIAQDDSNKFSILALSDHVENTAEAGNFDGMEDVEEEHQSGSDVHQDRGIHLSHDSFSTREEERPSSGPMETLNAGGDHGFIGQTEPRHCTEHSFEHVPSRTDSHGYERRQPVSALVIPDDIEYRPDRIAEIATMFCRDKSIDELEEAWCAPNGVRDLMRRDFKQKRQNAMRGRKLGSSQRKDL